MGLFAAGALRVGGHGFSLPLPHYLGHHSPRLLRSASRLSATSPSLRLVQWRHAWGCRRRRADDGVGPDHAILRAISVVQVTSLTVTVPKTVDVKELESEIVTAVADRLKDDHGYELVAEAGAGGSETRNEHPLHPAGSIAVDTQRNHVGELDRRASTWHCRPCLTAANRPASGPAVPPKLVRSELASLQRATSAPANRPKT